MGGGEASAPDWQGVDDTRVAPRAAKRRAGRGAGLLDVQRPAERAQSPLRNRL